MTINSAVQSYSASQKVQSQSGASGKISKASMQNSGAPMDKVEFSQAAQQFMQSPTTVQTQSGASGKGAYGMSGSSATQTPQQTTQPTASNQNLQSTLLQSILAAYGNNTAASASSVNISA